MEIKHLADIINLDKLQQFQDIFSGATGVASVITTPDGVPITRPSNFCELCSSVIRKTEKGLANCIHSDAELGKQDLNGPRIQPCLSGGLWDAGVSINVGGIHMANWLIGQVRNEAQNQEAMLKYADEIGADPLEFSNALDKVPVMSKEQFEKISNMLYFFVNEYTDKAMVNFQLQHAIEEIREKETELNWERTFVKALMDTIPDHVYFKDRQSRFIRSNISQANYFKIGDPELTKGKTDFDFFDVEHASTAFRDEQEIIEKEITISKEEKETWPDQTITWVSTVKAPLRDLDGNIIGTFGISRDITEKKAIEEKLIQSEDRFRTIVENMGEGLGIVNEHEEFIFTNPAASEIFGVQEGELLGRKLNEFMDDAQYKEVIRQSRRLKKGVSNIYELEVIRPDGETRSLLVSSLPKINRDGKLEGTYGVFRDITQRKINEQIIQKQNVELKEINSQKDKLFSIIAHDLRSPFASIIGLIDLISDKSLGLSIEQIQELALTLNKTVVATNDLLENLLDWSRMEQGLLIPKRVPFYIGQIIDHAVQQLSELAANKQIEIVAQITPQLEADIDERMITSVIRNLLSNAIKFTKRGGMITICAKEQQQFIVVSVVDSGVGIPAHKISKLFINNSEIGTPGTEGEHSSGLGLLLCKEFVEKHDGKIWAESEVGKGSTFHFSIVKNVR